MGWKVIKAKYRYDEDLNAYIPDEESETTIKELCTTGQGFIPIGYRYGANHFSGIFYGEKQGENQEEQLEIKNIYIKTANCAALFGEVSGATIKNITIGGEITCTSGNNAAGFVGYGHGCKLENCCNKCNITNIGTGYAAGIWGNGYSTSITRCINEGEIISVNHQAFGISSIFVKLNRCRNYGNVTGKSWSGGICRKRLGRTSWLNV